MNCPPRFAGGLSAGVDQTDAIFSNNQSMARAECLLAGADGLERRAAGWLRAGQRRTALAASRLNAGLWTIGLASCGSLAACRRLNGAVASRARTETRQGNPAAFRLGVHSVIDHLGELDTCLADISLRRLKGEKP
jgi:hypothetical protein